MGAALALGDELIVRRRILERLAQAHPLIVAIVAPAGFGKSTLVRQYAAQFDSFAICDMANVRGTVGFCDRVIGAIAFQNKRLQRLLDQQRLGATKDEQVWTDFLLHEWGECAHSLVIFENAEHIQEHSELTPLLGRLLATRSEHTGLAICSRVPLTIRLTRFAAPHQIVNIDTDELRFDERELRAVLGDGHIPPETFNRILQTSAGWPIAVLLLARFNRESRLDGMLERLEDTAYRDLHEYLIDHVLSNLSERQLRVTIAVAAIPRATPQDLEQADAGLSGVERIPEFLTVAPFMSESPCGSYDVHPLVRAALKKRYPSECAGIIQAAAEGWRRSGDLERAAELYAVAGQHETAAAILENVGTLYLDTPSPRYAQLVQSFDANTLLRYPALWAASTPCRAPLFSQHQWLAEAATVYKSLGPHTPSVVRRAVVASYANVLMNLGRHAEALELLDEAKKDDTAGEAGIFLDAMLRGAAYSRLNQFKESDRIWKPHEEMFRHRLIAYALSLNEIVAHAARVRGQRAAERAALEDAIVAALQSQAGLAICYTHMDAIFGAWLAGEDDLAMRYLHELEEHMPPFMVRATSIFIAAVRGQLREIVDGPENPRYRAYAYIIAAASPQIPRQERSVFAGRAVSAADLYGEPFLLLLAWVISALIDPARRDNFLHAAAALAARIDTDVPAEAIAALRAGRDNAGILAPLCRRLTLVSPAKSSDVRISILEGTVRLDEKPIRLSAREFEVLAALALRPHTRSQADLAELIWPESDADAGLGALRVMVTRLRAKLGAHVIATEHNGYRLYDGVQVDVEAIEKRLHAAHNAPHLSAKEFDALVHDFESVRVGVPSVTQNWSWFASSEMRVAELAHELGGFIAERWLEADEPLEALRVAQLLSQYDAFDEAARTIAIRARIAMGDLAGARTEFESYRRLLADELSAAPSAALTALISERR